MEKLSIYLCYLLRHRPEDAGLHMDTHGWVNVKELISGVNRQGKYTLNEALLEQIVAEDSKVLLLSFIVTKLLICNDKKLL